MGFEQELREYLERIARSNSSSPAPHRQLDELALRGHFLDRLRRLEASGAVSVRPLFEAWHSRLVELVKFLEAQPASVVPVEQAAAQAYAHRVVDEITASQANTLVDHLEIQTLLVQFGKAEVAAYALENRLLGRDARQREVITALGRVYLRLRGRDAIRWLLTSETLQTTGGNDPWRASTELLEAAMGDRGVTVHFETDEIADWQTLRRLVQLEVFQGLAADEPYVGEYRVRPALRDVVQLVLVEGPWHTALRALLEDERAWLIPSSVASATAATVEQTKLIAHEVRNALVPVRHDVDALRATVSEGAQLVRLDHVRGGVVRVLDFIESMVQTSEMLDEPEAGFDVTSAIDDALGWVDSERRVEWQRPQRSIQVVAPRNRLSRAVSNVLGNALQATSSGLKIRVSATTTGHVVRIVVDDSGPGVPLEHRQRVFVEGVTMRADGGGSGFGLAYARRVVEGALHGRIWCEDSDLGGARFVIELPVPIV